MSTSRNLLFLITLGAALGAAPLAAQAPAGSGAKPAAANGSAGKPAAGTVAAAPATTAVATFAGGCFWCMEPPYDKLPGVISTTSGYMGGKTKNPTYEAVSSGTTGHTEVVQVLYDPAKISYDRLLEVFWRNIDPTVRDRQFCDVGSQYRTGIFVHSDEQRKLAEATKAAVERTKSFKEPIVTPIETAPQFWVAEDYHQDYYLKNPVRYNYYRTGCGRDARLKALWGSAADK